LTVSSKGNAEMKWLLVAIAVVLSLVLAGRVIDYTDRRAIDAPSGPPQDSYYLAFVPDPEGRFVTLATSYLREHGYQTERVDPRREKYAWRYRRPDGVVIVIANAMPAMPTRVSIWPAGPGAASYDADWAGLKALSAPFLLAPAPRTQASFRVATTEFGSFMANGVAYLQPKGFQDGGMMPEPGSDNFRLRFYRRDGTEVAFDVDFANQRINALLYLHDVNAPGDVRFSDQDWTGLLARWSEYSRT
jgi:hypothetical protein